MRKNKYLSSLILALTLSLFSCINAPYSPSDPGGESDPGGGGNPPAPVEETVSVTFSTLYHYTQNFTTLTKGSFTIEAYKGYYGQTAPQYVESVKQLKLYASNELIISGTSIKYIEFDMTTYKDATIYLTKGTFDKSTGIWTGDTDNVKFTIGTGGQFGIATLKISNTVPTNPGGGSDPGGGGTSTKTKVTIPSHTLSDTNPPIDINSKGQRVSESTWNSFKNGGQAKFNNNYNYTYWYYVGGQSYTQHFTKNGYEISNPTGYYYYERKSGNTFYYYPSIYNYERSEILLDLTYKYTYALAHEVELHMLEFSKYTYDEDEGYYHYRDENNAFTSTVIFKGGYLTYLYYVIPSTAYYEIKLSFETTIEIPQSFYYE